MGFEPINKGVEKLPFKLYLPKYLFILLKEQYKLEKKINSISEIKL